MNSTYNITEQTSNPANQYFWKIAQFFVVFNLAVSLWAAVSIFRHKATRKQVISMRLAKSSSVLVMLKIASTQAITVVGRLAGDDVSGDVMCEIALDVGGCAYYLCNLSVYLFLWRRQHFLNSRREILPTSKLHALLSWFALFLMLAGGTTATIMIVAPSSYKSSQIGCVRRPGRMRAFIIAMLSQIATQIFIFALFARPFLLLRRRIGTETSQVAKITDARLKRAVKSSMVSTVVIATSDVVSMVITTSVFPLSTPRSFVTLFFDLSMVLNVVFVFLAFENSQIRFNPFSRKSLKKTLVRA